jgi:integrase
MEKFGKANIIPDLKEADDEVIFDTLQSWILYSSDSVIGKTVRNRFYAINNFLHYMGIKLHEKDIKQELKFPREVQEEHYGVKLEQIQLILDSMQYRKKTMFLCQMTGLMRVGELVQLRKKHVTDFGDNMMIKIPAGIAKFSKARTTFWSKEASSRLRPLLKTMNDDDLIFQKNENSQNAVIAVEQVLRRALCRVGLDQRYESTGRFMINTHSLRAYGITKLSRRDPNLAKKIAGHKGYLIEEYDRIDDDEKLALYQKYEGDLLIDKKKIKDAKINELEQEKEEANNSRRADNQDMFDIMSPEQLEELAKRKRRRETKN